MLLELRQLYGSLRAADVSVTRRDDHLVGYPAGKPLFRVALTDVGEVKSVDRVDRSKALGLLKYEVSKGGDRESAPGFNVPPLLAVPDVGGNGFRLELKELLKDLKKGSGGNRESREKALSRLMARCEPGWSKKERAITGCLTKAVAVLQAALSKGSGQDREALAPLVELLRREQLLNLEPLRAAMVRAVRDKLLDGSASSADIDSLAQLLFMKEAALVFELTDWSLTPANHPSIWQVVNKLLLQGGPKGASPAGNSADLDDVFGEASPPTAEKMPERRLPRLGNVKLRSNAASKACQARYGLTEGDSCPVGPASRASLADALTWLTAPEREGKTFRDISQACGFPYPALLLAFPDPLPSEPAAYAEMFASSPDEDQVSGGESRFVAAAEGVSAQLRKPNGEISDAIVKVFALGKRSGDARTKLLLSRQFSASRILEAAQEWRSAAQNVPPVFVWRFGDDGKLHRLRCNWTPSPAEVGRSLNLAWNQEQGELRSSRLSVFEFGSALTLLLDSGKILAQTTTRALHLAIYQWLPLLLRVGQHVSLGGAYTRWPNEQMLLPSILGLLLGKIGCWKEVYMNDGPYWIGRLLAIADRFHVHYCDKERDGKRPPSLIGNAIMPSALENPQSGLARLAERIALYQRVAARAGDDDGMSLLREAAEAANHIDPAALKDRASDEEKAQMLLGYLARPDLLETSPETSS